MSSFLTRMHTNLLWLGGAYAIFLASLVYEPVQSGLIYLHWVRLPLFTDFTRPERLGFSPGKVSNFYLTTPDGVKLGAWHILPQDSYETAIERSSIPAEGALGQSVFDDALLTRDTILYFHGNAATRAASNRVRVGRLMSAANCNFVIIDYRGFGDSSSTAPSETGLLIDARTAWDYLTITKGVPAERITIMGQSLGTGVTTGLVASLARENTQPKAMILIAPFSSITSLFETFKVASVVPILGPFATIPFAIQTFLKVLYTRFDTLSIIHTITSCPILIVHALNDRTIPTSHSQTIFSKLLEPPSSTSKPELVSTQVQEVTTEIWGEWGTVKRLKKENGQRIVYAEAVLGGHNNIGSTEATVTLIRQIMQ